MPHRTIHHEDPVSGFGGFLLVAGFLIAVIGLLIAFTATAQLTATTQLDGLAAYAIPIALAGLLIAGLGIALDQRRMARTVHDSVESTAQVLQNQLDRERSRERRERQKASMAPGTTSDPAGTLRRDIAPAPKPNSAPAQRPPMDQAPAPTSAVAPETMVHQGSAGTRHMHMPLPPPGEPAYPWSGGPGSPPPGPEPSPQPPHWQIPMTTPMQRGWRASEHENESARPEPWRHSRVRINPRR